MTWEIITLLVPIFVRVTTWVLLPPTATSPKLTIGGIAVREIVDPLPEEDPAPELDPVPGVDPAPELEPVPEPEGEVPELEGVPEPEPPPELAEAGVVLGALAPKKFPGPGPPPPPQPESKHRSTVQKATALACAPNGEKKDLDFFTKGNSVSYRPNDLN